ncbi:hypothetical protein ABZ614_10615 [Streptomyces sp. NPDC013178]|uniref:hypothetical protein n=1 Tax=unclassified Streptomyces TaxID=2593676 RepID=UPI0033D71CF9
MISAYERQGVDGCVPDPGCIEALLAGVARRSDVAPEVLGDARQAYGRVLWLLSEQLPERGRSYRHMLRIYELTREVEELSGELADVRQ